MFPPPLPSLSVARYSCSPWPSWPYTRTHLTTSSRWPLDTVLLMQFSEPCCCCLCSQALDIFILKLIKLWFFVSSQVPLSFISKWQFGWEIVVHHENVSENCLKFCSLVPLVPLPKKIIIYQLTVQYCIYLCIISKTTFSIMPRRNKKFRRQFVLNSLDYYRDFAFLQNVGMDRKMPPVSLLQ